MMNLKNKLKRNLSKKLFHYQWQLIFNLKNVNSKTYKDFKKIIPPNDRFWADPFIVFKDKLYYVFFEEFVYSKKKGHISFLIIDEKGNYSDVKKIIEKNYHISYPNIFNWNDKFYMIPESQENQTIEIYECLEFPTKWKFYKILFRNITATDSTLFYKDEKWWLFTTIIDEKYPERNGLSLFYSVNPLTDDWISHPKNPIVSGKKGSRSAGKIFEENNKILRPAQDETKRYGYGIIFYEIEILNEIDYKEKINHTIYPDWNENIIGAHTYAKENELTMGDIRIKKNKIIESLFENNNQLKWLHFIRKEEVETALEPFSNKKNNNILDIGGNDGFIANYISNKGYKITSIDQNLKNPQYFPVRKGNAEELDFKNNEFDIIFLSHPIAHIKNKELLFKECKRVLKENGVIIGIVPSGWWSLVTNFWHYVLLPKTLIKFILNLKESKQNIDKSNVNNYNGSKIKRIINLLFLHPLGTNPSFVHELYYFSKYYWKNMFKKYELIIVDVKNTKYFYSGHGIKQNKLLNLRRKFAKNGIPGSYCFILKFK